MTLMKASKNLMKEVTKSVRMTTIPKSSKMNRDIDEFSLWCNVAIWKGVTRGGGGSHIKRGGMLVVSLGGKNFGFWSHLGCFGQNAIICSKRL